MDEAGDEVPPNPPQEEVPHCSNSVKELLWCLAQHPDTLIYPDSENDLTALLQK